MRDRRPREPSVLRCRPGPPLVTIQQQVIEQLQAEVAELRAPNTLPSTSKPARSAGHPLRAGLGQLLQGCAKVFARFRTWDAGSLRPTSLC